MPGNLIVCRIFDRPDANIKLQITRSDRNLQKGWLWVPQLAPSWDLFKKFQSWRQAGEWPTMWSDYQEQFLNEMRSSVAQQCLDRIVARLQDDKAVAVGCYCTNKYCHRFIVGQLVVEKQGEKV